MTKQSEKELLRLEKCNKALGYWTIGIQYLHLVEIVTQELIKQGNLFVVISNDEISIEQYAEKTKWSDHHLVVPLLFDFYHGLELLLKGFLVAKGKSVSTNHKLFDLFEAFISLFPKHALGVLIRKYVAQNQLPEPLASFCAKSGISIDAYYQALKYPESTKNILFKHTPLKYRGDVGLDFFNFLASDIAQMRKDVVSLARSICP
jgi:hypothetical protein